VEIMEHGADYRSVPRELKLTNSVFVGTRALLDDRYSAADATLRLEVTHENDAIGDVSNVDGRIHVANEAVLGDSYKRRDAVSIEVLK